jgi:1,4-alpha-glucan branching enzyme
MTIAEESTAWPKVTKSVEDGGLGFTFKWNMDWMHDFCDYMKLDPLFRKNNHHKMTFAMSYNSSENYIMPLSHDEVVHLKCSMVNKMPGYQVDKYANLRVGYTYMFGHSGKKLLFMGQEFAQEREWSEARELDWFLLGEKLNKGMQDYVKELLAIYRKYSCLYEIDNDWGGFEWINANDGDRSIYSFLRKNSEYKNNLLFVMNMTPMARDDFRVGVPDKKKYKLLLNSDDVKFGGNGGVIPTEIKAEAVPWDDRPYSIAFPLPAYGAAIFVF